MTVYDSKRTIKQNSQGKLKKFSGHRCKGSTRYFGKIW